MIKYCIINKKKILQQLFFFLLMTVTLVHTSNVVSDSSWTYRVSKLQCKVSWQFVRLSYSVKFEDKLCVQVTVWSFRTGCVSKLHCKVWGQVVCSSYRCIKKVVEKLWRCPSLAEAMQSLACCCWCAATWCLACHLKVIYNIRACMCFVWVCMFCAVLCVCVHAFCFQHAFSISGEFYGFKGWGVGYAVKIPSFYREYILFYLVLF